MRAWVLFLFSQHNTHKKEKRKKNDKWWIGKKEKYGVLTHWILKFIIPNKDYIGCVCDNRAIEHQSKKKEEETDHYYLFLNKKSSRFSFMVTIFMLVQWFMWVLFVCVSKLMILISLTMLTSSLNCLMF